MSRMGSWTQSGQEEIRAGKMAANLICMAVGNRQLGKLLHSSGAQLVLCDNPEEDAAVGGRLKRHTCG